MTLQELCVAVSNDFMVTVTLGDTVVAEFQRSTYASIIETYLNATVSSVTFNSTSVGTKSMDVVITE